jgi:hypothetical protein
VKPPSSLFFLQVIPVFNDGQAIRSVSCNGTEIWKRAVSGAVSSLSMAAGGSLIVASTETGNIAGFDKNGNLLGNYASNPENQKTAGITCVAVLGVAPPQPLTTTTPTVPPVTYSVIRTATGSPLSYSTIVCSIVLAFLLLGKKQKT